MMRCVLTCLCLGPILFAASQAQAWVLTAVVNKDGAPSVTGYSFGNDKQACIAAMDAFKKMQPEAVIVQPCAPETAEEAAAGQREATEGQRVTMLADDDASSLSAAQRLAISDHLRRCWPPPTTSSGSGTWVLIAITTDNWGVVRRAVVAPADIARMSVDPALRQLAERAVRAVLDPNCANLPLPQAMLGQRREFTLRFTP
jgi:hypothetical protein